jgi:hypothetical protein
MRSDIEWSAFRMHSQPETLYYLLINSWFNRSVLMPKALGVLAFSFGAAMLLAPAAWATNIVQNAGFKADDASGGPVTPPTGWTVTDVGGITDVGVEQGFSNTGNNAAYIGYGTLSQTLATVIGTTYTVSFFVGIDDATTLTDPNATFTASLGGQDLLGGVPLLPGPPFPGSFLQCPNASSPCAAETTDSFTATAATSVLSFTGLTTSNGSSPDGLWYLDDVDVEAVAVAAPEPSGMLVLGVALTGIGLVRRRAV